VFTYLDLASVDWLGDYATVCHLGRSLVCRADLTDGGEGSRHLGCIFAVSTRPAASSLTNWFAEPV